MLEKVVVRASTLKQGPIEKDELTYIETLQSFKFHKANCNVTKLQCHSIEFLFQTIFTSKLI